MEEKQKRDVNVMLDMEAVKESLGNLGIDTSPQFLQFTLDEAISAWEGMICGMLCRLIYHSGFSDFNKGIISEEERKELEVVMGAYCMLKELKDTALKQE